MVPIGFYEGEALQRIGDSLSSTQSGLALEAWEKGMYQIGNAVSGLVEQANKFVDLVAHKYDLPIDGSKGGSTTPSEDLIYSFNLDTKRIELVRITIGDAEFFCPVVHIRWFGRVESMLALPDGRVHRVQRILESDPTEHNQITALSITSFTKGLDGDEYPIINGIERIKTADNGMLSIFKKYTLPDNREVRMYPYSLNISPDGYKLPREVSPDQIDRCVKNHLINLEINEKRLQETRENGGRMPKK